jgi:hypothetical protein
MTLAGRSSASAIHEMFNTCEAARMWAAAAAGILPSPPP